MLSLLMHGLRVDFHKNYVRNNFPLEHQSLAHDKLPLFSFLRYHQLNNLNFGTHIKKPDSMNHVKLIEFHKDSANCKSFVKDYNSLAKTVLL